jgi:hypothetical protein
MMSDFIYDLFKRRHTASSSEYVFPASSDSGHVMEPRKAMLKIAKLSGVSFTVLSQNIYHYGRKS